MVPRPVAAATTTTTSINGGGGLDRQSIIYMALLALQFGLQPILTRRFTPQGITRSTVILAQEVTKLLLAALMLYLSTGGSPSKAGVLKGWTIANWIEVAGVPAALYAIQNVAALRAYQNLDALTFNVLNQTKTLSAALCCYLIMGKRQSKLQVVALLLLLLAALVMEKIVKVNDVLNYTTLAPLFSWEYWKDWSSLSTPSFSSGSVSRRITGRASPGAAGTSSSSAGGSSPTTRTGTGGPNTAEATDHDDDDNSSNNSNQASEVEPFHWDMDRFTMGVAPILLASFISGLAGALSQRNLQRTSNVGVGGSSGRNPYLYSIELCVASVIMLMASWIVSDDGRDVLKHGFFAGWTAQTWIPILTNSFGGILVGLVTKYAGSVRKGFALIFGILLSGFVQAALSSQGGVSKEQWLGGILAVISLYLHATNPPQPIAAAAATTHGASAVAKAIKQD
ncbi:hypothetical protein ACA910_004792 [Epithemia clementina (nom. ined.)]